MSLDLSKNSSDQQTPQDNAGDLLPLAAPGAKDQWKSLRKKVRVRAESQTTKAVFGKAAKRGSVYRWGVAVSSQQACDPTFVLLTRMASGGKVSKKELSDVDFELELQAMTDRFTTGNVAPRSAVHALAWAAAMPELIDHLDYRVWWGLLGDLQQIRNLMLENADVSSLTRLIIGGELGLTLAWRLGDLPSCRRLRASSVETVTRWCQQDEDSVSSAIAGGRHARLALASLLRCRDIIENTSRVKFKKKQRAVLADLATWVAALTIQPGTNAFSDATTDEIKDDTKRNGLLDAAIECDPETLQPAINAARGRTQTGGRLTWEVCLPESIQHCEDAKLAVIMPEWDVRRGRTFIDYSGKEIHLEMLAGGSTVLSGRMQTSIDSNDSSQRPEGDWEVACEYTDDDVHYLELEQLWTGSLILQRQFMVVRDDCCVMIADSVLPSSTSAKSRPRELHYTCRIPVPSSIEAFPESETREILLSDNRARAMVIPMAASEWRVGPTAGTLRSTEDNHLLLSMNGKDRLYAPIWMDFQRRRFKRNRTWRQLTVADELRIVRNDEAVGYRIQAGSEQWMVYRSLGESRCRSLLGKHLVADFYAGRFYLNDGSLEELVTVDNTED